MKYEEYLQTDHWKKLRKQKYAKANRRCAICEDSESQLDVHHLTYKNLQDVKTEDLRILCHRCHFLVHDLMKSGVIKFRKDTNAHKFAVIKSRVKYALYGRKKKRKKSKPKISPEIAEIIASTSVLDRILRVQEIRR